MYVRDELTKLQLENKQLKEALKKCSPLEEYWDNSDLEGGYIVRCTLCKIYEETGLHAPDCEYMRLTKGSEVE